MRARALALVSVLAIATTASAQRPASLLTYSSPRETKQRSITLRRDGNQVVLVDDSTHAVVASSPGSQTQRVVVQGLEGDHTDTLTVDLRGGLSLPGGVEFDAGVAGFDTLKIAHDPAKEVRYEYEPDDARGHRGRVIVDGTVIAYSGIEPLTNTGTASNMIFTLPAGTVGASLQDDGTLGNGTVQLASTNATFETTTFAVPTVGLTLNSGGGPDTITTAANFSGDFHAGLSIAGTNTDVVTLRALALTNAGAVLNVHAKHIAVIGNITTTDGFINLFANQGSPASGSFNGITVSGATITSATGAIDIEGRAGDPGAGNNYGIGVLGGSVISSTGTGAGASTITLIGSSGAATSGFMIGILADAGTSITSVDGAITLTGTGGAGTGIQNSGVQLQGGAHVTSTGTGSITITGNGGGSGGASDGNEGVTIAINVSSGVTSVNGAIQITGTPGVGTNSLGIDVGNGFVNSIGTANINLTGNSIGFNESSAVINGGANTVTLQPQSAGTIISLGGVDVPGTTLGLTNGELARITAGTVVVGNTADTGGLTVSAPISAPATWNNLSLRNAGPFTATAGSLAVPTLAFVDGAATGHVWTIDAANITEASNAAIPYSTTTNLSVTGGTGADTFHVTPSAATTFTVDGNTPIPPVGDGLDVNTAGTTSPLLTATPSASGYSGTYTFGNRQTVNFSHIESFSATHFSVSAPASATAGAAFTFTVTALDQFNNTATGYAGTVHFTSSDGSATLPADATLTNGVGTFSATLRTAGGQTITATDTLTPGITGTSNLIAVSSAAATHFAVSAPANATAGSAFSITVTALDPFNNTATGYAGTVHFTSTDGQAVLPANSTLTNGTGTFSATLKTAGKQTITATDTVTPGITGTSNTILVSAAAATHFLVSAPASATSGTAFNFTVTAQDPFNNTATGYAGTVHFTSSDGQAVLPANSTLTNGTGTFSSTLKTAGNQTITATDTVTSSITGTSNTIAVSAAAGTHFLVSAPATATAGTAFNFTVTAQDPFNNTATGYAGTVHFSSSDGQAVLPANSTLTNGTGTFSSTLKTAGNQTITASDTVTPSITGTSNTIAVNAAAATHFAVSAPATATAGAPFNFTVTAQDQFNNTATAYAGTVHFTSSDGSSTLPANSTLTNGTGTFSATLGTAGTQTITATDTVTSSITGTSAAIVVSALADLAITKSGPGTANPGTNVSYTIVVTNNGPSDALSVSFSDLLPAGTTFVSESQTTGPSFACTTPAVGGTGTVTCSIATLLSGASASFTVVLQTTSASFSNTATVSSSTPDPNAGNNSSTSATGINTADVGIVKTASAPIPFGGQAVSYTIVVSNAGPATATSVTVTDVLPAGSTLVSSTPPGTCSGSPTVTCSIATLNNGASTTITLVVTAPLAGGTVSNTATVSAAEADPNPANNSSTATVSLQPASNIPTLSEEILLLLAAVIALIGAFRLRS
jgi:uncharacterized repeat protein (TIGR01451 family)